MIRLIGTRCTDSNVFSRGVLIVRFLLGNLKIIFCCVLLCLAVVLYKGRSAFSFQVLFVPVKTKKFVKNSLFSVGGLMQESHLFSFRTQKLSLVVSMILFMGKVDSRQH